MTIIKIIKIKKIKKTLKIIKIIKYKKKRILYKLLEKTNFDEYLMSAYSVSPVQQKVLLQPFSRLFRLK